MINSSGTFDCEFMIRFYLYLRLKSASHADTGISDISFELVNRKINPIFIIGSVEMVFFGEMINVSFNV